MSLEPEFKVQIPVSLGKHKGHFATNEISRINLVVLQQIHGSPTDELALKNQEGIFQICKHLHESWAYDVVTFDTSDEDLFPESRNSTFSDLMNTTPVSAGVMQFLHTAPKNVHFHGVDDMEMVRQSWGVMDRIKKNRDLVESVFGRLTILLKDAQRMVYQEPIRKLRTSSLPLYKSDTRLGDRINWIFEMMESLKLMPDAFPALHLANSAMILEGNIDFEAAENQGRELLAGAMRHANNWIANVKNGNQKYDDHISAGMLGFWQNCTGMADKEVAQNCVLRGKEKVLLECAEWLKDWLADLAIKSRTGNDPLILYNGISAYCLSNQIKNVEIPEFQKQLELQRIKSAILVDADAVRLELVDCENYLIEKMGGDQAIRLRNIESQLDALYFSLLAETPSVEAEFAEYTRGQLIECSQRLSSLMGFEFDKKFTSDINFVDDAIDLAIQFRANARKRSRILIDNTFKLITKLNKERAVLVIGGYHTRLVERILEKRNDIAWCTILPGVRDQFIESDNGPKPL